MSSKYWDDIWTGLLLAATAGLVAIIGVSLCADHRVRSYYVSAGGTGTVCISADINWDTDETVACSDDRSKIIADVERLNATVRGTK